MPVESRSVTSFDKIRFSGMGKLNVSQGNDEFLIIRCPEYVMHEIESLVKNGTLYLGYKSGKVISLLTRRENISFELQVKDLREIQTLGSGVVNCQHIDTDHLTVTCHGSGSMRIGDITADSLEVRLKGSGGLSIEGDVEIQSVILSGSGDYEAEKLISDFATVQLSGSGQLNLSVSDTLNVQISGSGSVNYRGFPDVSKQLSGSGKLVRRRRSEQIFTRSQDSG